MNDPLNINRHCLNVANDQAVFLGCSFTSGVGVGKKQRYSALMCQQLNLRELNLADIVLNNYKSFDVFSQLSFESAGNTVILQLTELSRIQVYTTEPKIIQLSVSPTKSHLDVYHDKFLIFELIKNLRWFVQVCRMQKIKLVIWSIARVDPSLQVILENYLCQFPEYVYLSSNLGESDSYRIDNGTDGTGKLGTGHPGPLSHKLIAQKLLTHYNNLYL